MTQESCKEKGEGNIENLKNYFQEIQSQSWMIKIKFLLFLFLS